MVIENDLFQLVCEPTHKDNNILDFVLSKCDNLSVSLSKQLFLDHFPVHLYFNSIPVPICLQKLISKSSFNAILFTTRHHETVLLVFPSLTIVDIFLNSINLKRAIRKQLPPFYSSHTVHLNSKKVP